MVKIAFHDNYLGERGTTVAVYDYAYYNIHILGNESIIMYNKNSTGNDIEVINKFKKCFKLCPYDDWSRDADNILRNENCEILYLLKSGEYDGKISNICKNIVHCVFNTSFPHGDVYGRISNCFGNSYPIVNHMINLPMHNNNMRNELNIPEDALVFGRHGGLDQFDIKFVQIIIDSITDSNNNIYFLFVNTNKFCKEKKNIIHLNKIIDLEKKVEFINTCDAMIHARQMGETFGSAVAEFSTLNKPIITNRSGDIAHLNILKDKAIIYNNPTELNNIFLNFKSIIKKNKDWNCYINYTPEIIMNEFNNNFIKPCLI